MPDLGTELVRVSIAEGVTARPSRVLPGSSLTPREMDVLQLMAEGLTTKAIGVRLNVRFKTAACHRSRILQKLGVNSTVSAVRWAIREGHITP